MQIKSMWARKVFALVHQALDE